MKVLVTILLVFVVGVFGLSELAKKSVRENFGDHRLVSISVERDLRNVMKLLKDHNVDEIGHYDKLVHLKVSPVAARLLEREGIEFSDVTAEFLDNVERNLNSADFVCEDDFVQCAIRTPDEFYGSYQRYESLHERFRRFGVAYPEVATWETLGTTFEGREQKVLMIGDQTLPLVFYFCAIHAREWITPMYCTYMAETLLDTSNVQSRELLKKYSFAIMPVANPDGYVFTHEENNFWRKTRKPNPENPDCVGTDPNRNYAVGFGGEGTSTNPCSDIYHGAAPFDQPCTRNIKDFTDLHQDRLIHINDVHAHGGYWMSPYAGTLELPPEEDWVQMDTCNKAVQGALNETSDIIFKVGPVASTIYEAAGASVDYFYESNGVIHSYTYEARSGGQTGLDGFQPPTENIKISNHELYVGFLAALDCIESFQKETIIENEVPNENESPNVGSKIGGGVVAAILFSTFFGALVVGAVVSMKVRNRNEESEEREKIIEL